MYQNVFLMFNKQLQRPGLFISDEPEIVFL